MTDERLIEEAAKAIGKVWRNVGTHEDMARAALTVFESAHAPTDDERHKAIWRAVVEECQGHNGGAPHATTWARGGYRNDVPTLCDRCARLIETLQSLPALRRSEVPEPSAEQIAAYRKLADRAADALRLPRGRLETTKKLAGLTLPLSVALDHFLASAEPQGEPSDAQVEAAMEAYAEYRESDGPGDAMRAALRAAGEVS